MMKETWNKLLVITSFHLKRVVPFELLSLALTASLLTVSFCRDRRDNLCWRNQFLFSLLLSLPLILQLWYPFDSRRVTVTCIFKLSSRILLLRFVLKKWQCFHSSSYFSAICSSSRFAAELLPQIQYWEPLQFLQLLLPFHLQESSYFSLYEMSLLDHHRLEKWIFFRCSVCRTLGLVWNITDSRCSSRQETPFDERSLHLRVIINSIHGSFIDSWIHVQEVFLAILITDDNGSDQKDLSSKWSGFS